MKSQKRFLFSAFFLVLSLFMTGAQTFTSGDMPPFPAGCTFPGEYLGTFHFNTREISMDSMKTPLLSTDVKDNRLMSVDGTMKISMTSPTEGIIYISPSNYMIYDIRDISAMGSKIECKMTGYLEIEAHFTFLSSLSNSYDPQKRSFLIPILLDGWSVENFQNIVKSDHPACTQQVNEQTLTALVQNFFDVVTKYSPMVFHVAESSDEMMRGSVYLDGYDKTTDFKGGWTQRELRGSWHVTKQPIKDEGWKK